MNESEEYCQVECDDELDEVQIELGGNTSGDSLEIEMKELTTEGTEVPDSAVEHVEKPQKKSKTKKQH